MKYIFLLSGDYIDLGREEIVSLFDVKKYEIFDKLLIVELKGNENSSNGIFKRLALTKNIHKFLFECKIDELINRMKNFDWNSVYKNDFCLRVNRLDNNIKNAITKKSINEKRNKQIFNKKSLTTSLSKHNRGNPLDNISEKNLAGYIWRKIKNPKVKLENPKTLIQLFIIKDKVFCGLLVYQNKEDFEYRKSHLRPFPHPSSLHPKVARALINITGIKNNEILLDPFCGTGGFLIEAGLMGIKTIGYDINKIMIDGCVKNLKYYKINNYKIKNQNALDINDKFDYAVTDLPYGLNSNAMVEYDKTDWKKGRINIKMQKEGFYKNLEGFYLKFLKNLRKKLKKKVVIVFPDYVDYKRLLKQSKFKIEKEFENYVHRSLTRKIVKIV